jgi:transcriptional regulator with XRE-family HTH domain
MAANHNLKNALQDAGLTLEEFAAVLSVDPKSVGRWIAGTSTPYPRHRAAISRALALEEADLWPEHARPTVELDGEPNTPARERISGRLRGWADSDDPTAPDPVELVTGADGPIDILDADIWVQLAGPVADAISAHAAAGHPVRVASGAPRPYMDSLIRQAGIQLRCVDAQETDLIRTNTTMLIATRLGAFADQAPALFHVEADGPDGLYDRLSTLFDTLWEDPVEIIATVDQLEAYRTNAYDDPEDDTDDDPESDGDGSNAGAGSDVLSPSAESASPARRWPGSRGREA